MKGIKIVDLMAFFNLPGERNPLLDSPMIRDVESKEGNWVHPAEYMFKEASANTAPGTTPEELIDLMDKHGVEKAMIGLYPQHPDDVLKVIEKYSDRFVGKVYLDPNYGMKTVRQLDGMVRNHGVKAASMLPCAIGKAPNDKIYYPIYAKCIELDVPICINVGIPGPRMPGEVQNPMYLDEVCWFWPELKVVMMHGGEPWAFTCAKLMLKWPGLHYMTSGFAPRYYPKEIIDFANTRGSDKVMFAGYHPTIHYDRLMRELGELPLRDHVWPKFLRENAMRVFKL